MEYRTTTTSVKGWQDLVEVRKRGSHNVCVRERQRDYEYDSQI